MCVGRFVAIGLLALILTAVSPVSADDGADVYEAEAASEAKSLSAEEISDDQLERYVAAESEIASIRLRHANDIASRGVDSAGKAQEEMAATIEEHGLTVRGYREIAHLARKDPDVSRRARSIKAHGH